MIEQGIENFIYEVLIGNEYKNALEFVTYLRANDMLFKRGGGYWEGKKQYLEKNSITSVALLLDLQIRMLKHWS
jgi:hypothetical protein